MCLTIHFVAILLVFNKLLILWPPNNRSKAKAHISSGHLTDGPKLCHLLSGQCNPGVSFLVDCYCSLDWQSQSMASTILPTSLCSTILTWDRWYGCILYLCGSRLRGYGNNLDGNCASASEKPALAKDWQPEWRLADSASPFTHCQSWSNPTPQHCIDFLCIIFRK